MLFLYSFAGIESLLICSTGFVVSGHADQLQASISVNAVVNISIKKHSVTVNTATLRNSGKDGGRKIHSKMKMHA